MCYTYDTGCQNVFGGTAYGNTENRCQIVLGGWNRNTCGCTYPRICRDYCGNIYVHNPCQRFYTCPYATAGVVTTNQTTQTNVNGYQGCPYANTVNAERATTNISPNVHNRCCCLNNNQGVWWTGTGWISLGTNTMTNT